MTNLEQKIIELVSSKHEPDFDFDVEHWENGNFDDSWSYGVDCGEQYILKGIKKLIDEYSEETL